MAKYHISPAKGPRPCSATPGNCRFGISENQHYASEAEAQAAYDKQLAAENSTFSTMKKSDPASIAMVERGVLTEEQRELEDKLETEGYPAILKFASESPEKHRQLDELIDARAQVARRNFERIDAMNPYSDNCKTPISYGSYRKLKEAHDSYRDITAVMVQAHQSSPHYSSPVEELSSPALGRAVQATSYDHDDVRWHTSRFDTVGGSDVGVLAANDFGAANKKKKWDREKMEKLERSKVEMITEEEAEGSIAVSELFQRGALYRGTMWEERIRDGYCQDHPELKVYSSKNQYTMENKDWVRINVDGITSDRPDGKPNGILEIKTGGNPSEWENGVPQSYRAQALYYLHVTGFDHADVRVTLNDGETWEYRLNASDEVAPGCGQNMAQYIERRIEPWFQGLRGRRAPAVA